MQDQVQIKVRGLLPHVFVALAVVFFAASDVSVEKTPVYKNSKAPIEQRVDDLLARLTGKEKVSLMGEAPNSPRNRWDIRQMRDFQSTAPHSTN
jgi:hypothetical protein